MAIDRGAAREFAVRWAGRGDEKQECQKFWLDLLEHVLDYRQTDSVLFETRVASGGFIDVWIRDAGVMIEQKSLDVGLDKPEERQGVMKTPLQQVWDYAQNLDLAAQPRFLLTCNFGTFRVYDRTLGGWAELSAQPTLEFTLEEFGEHPEYLGFITDPKNSRLEKEKDVSIQAGTLIGRLYDLLAAQYLNPDSPATLHALNVLCVRLVFCLYCEDAGLFAKDGFYKYLHEVPAADIRPRLQRLFQALDTPLAERDPYDTTVAGFPYVNGGLFTEAIEIPNFTPAMKELLLEEVSGGVDWSRISPTIFGGIFESTLNPQTRRAGGMHYTSPQNIHKVIDPLFLDDLKAELAAIGDTPGLTPRQQNNRYRDFHRKLCSLRFLDPASGSGNFLTETYLELRNLENQVLFKLQSGQSTLTLGEGETAGQRVTLSQFYGIEVNDFAVKVAEVALWISRLRANEEADMLLSLGDDDFPLVETANITCGNALTLDWNQVLPAEQCDYILGNPPFIGYSRLDATQKADRQALFGKPGGVLDYVACWYQKAADYMTENQEIQGAFVSTNSIVQGQQVAPLWQPLFSAGVTINFAHRTFVWSSEATDQAHVYCVIIGFSFTSRQQKYVWDYSAVAGVSGSASVAGVGTPTRSLVGSRAIPLGNKLPRGIYGRRQQYEVLHEPAAQAVEPIKRQQRFAVAGGTPQTVQAPSMGTFPRHLGVCHEVSHLNGYLAEAPDVFLERRAAPLSDVPPMVRGNQPTDAGNLLLSPEERTELLAAEPEAERWIRKFSMGAEFINGKDRYCLWLEGITPQELYALPLVRERVERVRQMRLESSKAATRKKAETPWLFDEIRYRGDGTYIGIPKVSSERREYIPMGFVTDGMIPGDKLYFIPTDSLYIFGVLMSRVHNAWMRAVSGRLKSDYSYGNTTVYNNLVWPHDPVAVAAESRASRNSTESAPGIAEEYRELIAASAQGILDARANYPEATLAELYDPDKMPADLLAAHETNNQAVAEAYGVSPKTANRGRFLTASHSDCADMRLTPRGAAYGLNPEVSEDQIVAHLFKLYARATHT